MEHSILGGGSGDLRRAAVGLRSSMARLEIGRSRSRRLGALRDGEIRHRDLPNASAPNEALN